jgi:hypothetical protein
MQEHRVRASRSFFLYVAAAILAGVLIGPANAARRPTRSERVHIVAATKRVVLGKEVKSVTIETVRVSTVDSHWALVDLNQSGYGGNGLGPLVALLYRDVYGYWSVLYTVYPEADDQTRWFRMGCLVTPGVRRDLSLVCTYRRG